MGVHAWDMAAGDIIVREAGGTVIDPAGNWEYNNTIVPIKNEYKCNFMLIYNTYLLFY